MEEIILFYGIAALLLLMCLTIIGYVIYSGLLHDIQVGAGEPPIGTFVGLYKFKRGPYKNVKKVFQEACSLAPKLKCFGVYYDDPKKVAPENLRWAVGSIVDDSRPDEITALKENGFKEFTFPAISSCVRTVFPFRTVLSVIIAVYRVYPIVFAYVEEHKLCAPTWIEIYGGNVIHFMAPLSKQAEFVVPEAEAVMSEAEATGNKTEESNEMSYSRSDVSTED